MYDSTTTSPTHPDVDGVDRNRNDEERSQTNSIRSHRSARSNRSSSSSSSVRSFKKGLSSMGKGMKKIFTTSPEKRRRRRRKGRSGNNEEDDDGSYVSNDSSLEGNMQSAAAANAHPNGDGRRSMLGDGGNGVGLPRVIEGENEDYDSDSPLKNSIRSKQQQHRNSKSNTSTNLFQTQKKNSNHALTNRSLTTRSRIAPLPAASEVDNEQTADPLSLVILLVDPVSLRFELLSLDFDLVAAMVTAQRKWTKKEKKKRKKGFRRQTKKNKTNTTPALLSLALTVQDVLDQITPESLTDETLQRTLRTNHHVPIGLIDRTEQIHYGAVSLDEACAARPLRTPIPTTSTDGGAVVMVQPSSLWKLTYTGEAHRDVLVGYLGDPTVEGGGAVKSRTTGEGEGGTAGLADATGATERIRKAIELAKPILNDTKVVQMMEANGYNLTGWSEKASTSTNSPGSTTTHNNGDGVPGHRGSNTTGTATGAQQRSMAMLQAPLPPNKRMKKWMEYTIVKVLVAVAVIVVSTLTAWSIVAGGVHVLPSISYAEANISAGDSFSISIPSTTSAASVSPDGIIRNDGLGVDTADAIAAHYHERSARTTTTKTTKTETIIDTADAIAAHYHKRSARTTTTRTTKTETIRTN